MEIDFIDMSEESDENFLPTSIKQYGLEKVPKAVKFLLDWYCRGMQIQNDLLKLNAQKNSDDEVTVNDLQAVASLLADK